MKSASGKDQMERMRAFHIAQLAMEVCMLAAIYVMRMINAYPP
jgi:hypothetical protein